MLRDETKALLCLLVVCLVYVVLHDTHTIVSLLCLLVVCLVYVVRVACVCVVCVLSLLVVCVWCG